MMRRKERERSAEWALELLRGAEYATLAIIGEDGSPYLLHPHIACSGGGTHLFPLCCKGDKLDNITRDPRVCITCATRTRVLQEKFTTEYQSTVAFLKSSPIPGRKRKPCGNFVKSTRQITWAPYQP